MYLGLHFGEVFYGKVGGHDRLDLTVVGPHCGCAIRSISRRRRLPMFGDIRRRLVSVGRYALRGVSHPQELFTLDPDA